VIIVGGGPVGLAAALELARFNVPSIVVEQHDSTSWHLKTRNLNTRTMEIARGWGRAAYQRLRGIDTPPGWKSAIRFFDTVVGHELQLDACSPSIWLRRLRIGGLAGSEDSREDLAEFPFGRGGQRLCAPPDEAEGSLRRFAAFAGVEPFGSNSPLIGPNAIRRQSVSAHR
jgi:glycine/D-amino acid oxidase-like deaminating enzyme